MSSNQITYAKNDMSNRMQYENRINSFLTNIEAHAKVVKEMNFQDYYIAGDSHTEIVE